MPATLLVIYEEPQNPAAFRQHYFQIQVPLAKALPGLATVA